VAAQFKDRLNRSWLLSLDLGECRRVCRLHDVDLANWHDGKALHTLLVSDEKLVAVLWCLIEEQAKTGQIDEEEFARGLNGDVLATALEALTEAIVLFTRPDRRELVRQIAVKATQTQDDAVRRAIGLVNSQDATDRITVELDKAELEARRKLRTPGPSSGVVQASSASSPGAGPSAS
jgi:hypothetical protein